MNGILLIALGEELYAKLATVCAASIKKKSPNIPIAIIHSKGILDNLSNRQKDLFDQKIEIDILPEGVEYTVMDLKTRLYDISPFSNTLFIDADSIVTPANNIEDIFLILKDVDFAPYNDGFWSDNKKDDAYPLWATPEQIYETYGISTDTKLPKINSSFLWFKKNLLCYAIFKTANKIFNDSNKFKTWRGFKPDEFCFNVALAAIKVKLHQYPFEPTYLYFKHPERSKEYVIDNFPLMSTIGDTVKDPRVITMYNDFMAYYFQYHGLKNLFYYEHKKKKKSGSEPIYVFWHICMINDYQKIIREQLKLIKKSGLYEKANQIQVGLVGDGKEIENVRKIFSSYTKIKILTHKKDLKQYEYPTLKLVKERSKQEQEFICLYLHTKGVSFPNNEGGKYWRDYMNYYNITLWKDCVRKLNEGCEAVGVKWIEESPSWRRHFSGNYWWTKSEYITRLPEINELNIENRFFAEFWIGLGNPRIHSLNQMHVDYNTKGKFTIPNE